MHSIVGVQKNFSLSFPNNYENKKISKYAKVLKDSKPLFVSYNISKYATVLLNQVKVFLPNAISKYVSVKKNAHDKVFLPSVLSDIESELFVDDQELKHRHNGNSKARRPVGPEEFAASELVN